MRAAIEDQLQIDRLWLATKRKRIALDADATAGERLAALRDLEKSLGGLAPDTFTIWHSPGRRMKSMTLLMVSAMSTSMPHSAAP